MDRICLPWCCYQRRKPHRTTYIWFFVWRFILQVFPFALCPWGACRFCSWREPSSSPGDKPLSVPSLGRERCLLCPKTDEFCREGLTLMTSSSPDHLPKVPSLPWPWGLGLPHTVLGGGNWCREVIKVFAAFMSCFFCILPFSDHSWWSSPAGHAGCLRHLEGIFTDSSHRHRAKV